MTLNYCKVCREYTLKKSCPKCEGVATKPHPARFSPEDRYGEYRRRLKLEAVKGG